MTTILEDIVAEGERVLGLASQAGVPMRLLGGVAVGLHAEEIPRALDRQYKDLDFAVTKKAASAADQVLKDAGYEPHVSFNAMHARERGLYFDDAHGRQVDLFVHSFRMCHEITLGDRLDVDAGGTVPLAELLLTKLQIIEVNEKDIRDMGLWRTITANLERCRSHVDDYELPDDAGERIGARFDAILERIEAEPKS